jgi:hypothetical protein
MIASCLTLSQVPDNSMPSPVTIGHYSPHNEFQAECTEQQHPAKAQSEIPQQGLIRGDPSYEYSHCYASYSKSKKELPKG